VELGLNLENGVFVPRRELYIACIDRAGDKDESMSGIGKSALAVLADLAASQNAVVGSDVFTDLGRQAFGQLVEANIYQNDPWGGIYSILSLEHTNSVALSGSFDCRDI
jgi:hypothetical protein